MQQERPFGFLLKTIATIALAPALRLDLTNRGLWSDDANDDANGDDNDDDDGTAATRLRLSLAMLYMLRYEVLMLSRRRHISLTA